jgi:hypothetical protein
MADDAGRASDGQKTHKKPSLDAPTPLWVVKNRQSGMGQGGGGCQVEKAGRLCLRTATAKALPVAESKHSRFFNGAESLNGILTAELQRRGEKSQRDFIIQPSVDSTKSGLRWVTNHK